MAKKRFTDGLSDLFENPFNSPAPESGAEEEAVASSNEEAISVEVDVPVKSDRARKKLSGKGFTGSLDSFLGESFEATNATPGRGPRGKRRTGLDFLIRSTVKENDEDRNPVGEKSPDTKRVTLIFRKDHLLELKGMAKERGMYLKDLVAEMAEKYLEE